MSKKLLALTSAVLLVSFCGTAFSNETPISTPTPRHPVVADDVDSESDGTTDSSGLRTPASEPSPSFSRGSRALPDINSNTIDDLTRAQEEEFAQRMAALADAQRARNDMDEQKQRDVGNAISDVVEERVPSPNVVTVPLGELVANTRGGNYGYRARLNKALEGVPQRAVQQMDDLVRGTYMVLTRMRETIKWAQSGKYDILEVNGVLLDLWGELMRRISLLDHVSRVILPKKQIVGASIARLVQDLKEINARMDDDHKLAVMDETSLPRFVKTAGVEGHLFEVADPDQSEEG